MAEEPIIFPVTDDGGVERLAAAFDALGINGAKALDLLSSKTVKLDADSRKFADVQQLVAQYFNAGGQYATELSAALSRLSDATLMGAASNERFIASLQIAGVTEQAFEAKITASETAIEGMRQASIAATYAEADAILAKSVRAMEALKVEESAHSAHAAFLKDIARDEAYSIQASYDMIAAGTTKVSDAMMKAQQAASASAQEGARLRTLAAFEEEAALSEAMMREAYALDAEYNKGLEHAAQMKALAFDQANYINAQYDKMVAQNAIAMSAFEAETKAAMGNITGLFTGIVGQIAAFATAAGAIHAIDGIDQVTQQLRAVLPNAQAVDAAFTHLSDTAIATQSPLEVVTKNFTALYSSMKQTGKSAEEALAVTDSLTKMFYVTGASSQEASRSLHDFSEAMATGNLSGQQLLSFLRNTPQAAGLLSEAMGVNIQTLTQHALAVEHATDRVNNIKAAMNSNVETMGRANQAYTTNQHQIESLTTKLADEEATLKRLKTERGNHTVAIQNEERAIAKTETSLNNARNATAGLSSDLAKATSAHKDHQAAQLKTAEATLKVKEGLSAERIEAVLTSDTFKLKLDALAQTATGTVRGAFVALNDQIEVYLKTSGDASLATTAVKDALGLLGRNLDVVIPSIINFGAAWVAVKIGGIIISLGQLAVAAAFSLANLNPMVLALGVAASAALILFAKTDTGKRVIADLGGEFRNLTAQLTGTKSAQDALKGAIDGGNSSVQSYQLSVTNLTNEQIKHLDTMRAAGAAQDTLVKQSKDYIAQNDKSAVSVQDLNKQYDEQSKAVDSVGTSVRSTTSHVQELSFTVDQETGKQVAKWTDVSRTIDTGYRGAIRDAGADTQTWTTTTVNGLTRIIELANQAAQAMRQVSPASGAATGATVPASAAGSSFTVGGASGVDSRLIAVSPGEHVTVQTPEQHYAGKVNSSAPGVKKFRDGGTTSETAPFEASSASITGYKASALSDYLANIAITVAGPAAAAVNDNVAPLSAITAMSPQVTDTSAKNASKAATSTAAAPDTSSTASGTAVDPNAAIDALAKSSKTRQAAIEADLAAIASAQTVNSIDGVSRPTGSQYGGVSKQEAEKWIWVNGQWVGKPGAYPGRTNVDDSGVATAYQKYREDMAKPVTAFRDGGSFTVAGSSGVDSQLLKLMVSPGERVKVETPEQQRKSPADVALAGRGQTIVMNITTDNADTFRKSQNQIASDAKRKLARVR